MPDYPDRERVEWYREHCDPKLKIKVDALGGLVYPCENHSYSAGSLEEHSIRELWSGRLTRYANESCLGCGKQRFRSHLFKDPRRLATRSGRWSGAPTRGSAGLACRCRRERPSRPTWEEGSRSR